MSIKELDRTAVGGALNIGRSIAVLMQQHDYTLEQAAEILHAENARKPSRNTVLKYYRHYVTRIRKPAQAAGVDEGQYFREFTKRQQERRDAEWNEARRNGITVSLLGFRGDSEALASALETWLLRVIRNEADRVRKHDIDAEQLVVTLSYRAAKKYKPK